MKWHERTAQEPVGFETEPRVVWTTNLKRAGHLDRLLRFRFADLGDEKQRRAGIEDEDDDEDENEVPQEWRPKQCIQALRVLI